MDFWMSSTCESERARKNLKDGKKVNTTCIFDRSLCKLPVKIQVALHSCDSFFINNRNMTGNSVELTALLWM